MALNFPITPQIAQPQGSTVEGLRYYLRFLIRDLQQYLSELGLAQHVLEGQLQIPGNVGFHFGSGAPTISAAKGSIYIRSDGSGVNNRAYINTDGGTTWTAFVTVA